MKTRFLPLLGLAFAAAALSRAQTFPSTANTTVAISKNEATGNLTADFATGTANITISQATADTLSYFNSSKNERSVTLSGLTLSSGTLSVDAATTSAAGKVELATDAEAVAGTDTARVPSVASMRAGVAPLRNSLAPRGGVAFDGTANKGFQSALTGQNISTDPFAVHLVVEPNSSAPSGTNDVFVELGGTSGGGATANALLVRGEAGGELKILLWGASSSDFNRWSFSGFYSTYGGKAAHIDIVRNASGNPTIYVNGQDVTASGSFDSAGTPPTWQGSITSTYLVVGQTQSLKASVFGVTLYTLALSASDVREIYQLGGAVPFRFQFGSQAERITATADRDMSGANNWTIYGGTGSATVGGGVLTIGATTTSHGSQLEVANSGSFAAGKRYRFGGTLAGLTNATSVILSFGGSGGETVTDSLTNGAFVQEHTIGSAGGVAANMTSVAIGLFGVSGSASVTLDDFTIKQVGAVVHLSCDDGIGYQIHDASPNKLDAVMTTTGVYHLVEKRQGYVRTTFTWSGTNEQKTLAAAQRLFPNGYVPLALIASPTASTSGTGVLIGTTNNPGRWVANIALTANTRKRFVMDDELPAGTAEGDANFSITPDNAAYTGSITAELLYQLMEGTP